MSGVPQYSVLSSQLFLLDAAELFSILENNFTVTLTTLFFLGIINPSPGERRAVRKFLNRDLNKVSIWGAIHEE